MQNIPINEFLTRVQKPIQYIGNEINIIKKNLNDVSLHGVLCFPDTYDVGMSHLGSQILYHIVNNNPFWALSRCYHPAEDAEKIMREKKIPLYCLEYLIPIKNADWIGFSVTYELQYTNILNMIDLAGLPVFSSQRNSNYPIIIAGGPVVTNPEPLLEFIDVFSIGDGENAIIEICKIIEEGKKLNFNKQTILKNLSKLPYIYVPSFFSHSKKGIFFIANNNNSPIMANKIDNLATKNYPVKPLVPLLNVVHHRLAIEVMRGCTRGYRFCSAGFYYRPVRERDAESIICQIKNNINYTGWQEIGLLSLSTTDYSQLSNLLKDLYINLSQRHINVSLPSTRIDSLSEEIIDLIQSIYPISSITIAPEAGTQRLRNIINKCITEDEIFSAINKLIKRNIQTLKLYFMIGLPHETNDDIIGIIDLIEKISIIVKKNSSRTKINVAISPFSPKPNTPFQWEAMDMPDNLLNKSLKIKKHFYSQKNIKISYRDPFMATLETIMARGDKSISKVIYTAWKKGAKFDGWDEFFDFNLWQKAFSENNIDYNIFLNSIPVQQILPWSIISTGIDTSFLLKEKEKAYNNITTSDCRKDYCNACGVCNNKKYKIKEIKHESYQVPKSRIKIKNKPESKKCLRIFYLKNNFVRFLGHLDMVNVIKRAFFSSNLPLAYSCGYHPHPLISFGPPLPCGISGQFELLDITLLKEGMNNFNLDSINKFLPEGLKLLYFYEIPEIHESLNKEICAGIYYFKCLECGPLFLSNNFVLHINEFLSQKEIKITINKNGLNKIKNIRNSIVNILPKTEKNILTFYAVLMMEPHNNCKPSELIKGLFPLWKPYNFYIERICCLKKEKDKFIPFLPENEKNQINNLLTELGI